MLRQVARTMRSRWHGGEGVGGFVYGKLEPALAAASGLDAVDIRNRLRHLRRVGVPKLPRTGSGHSVPYSRGQALQMLIGVRLTMIGIAPRLIQPLAQYILIAHDRREEREKQPEIAIIAQAESPFFYVDFDYAKTVRPQPQNICDGDPDGDLIICLLPAIDLLERSWPAETLVTSFRDFSNRPGPRSAAILAFLLDQVRRYQAVGAVHFHGEARLAQFVAERWLPESYAAINVSVAARKLNAALGAAPSA